MNMSQESQLFPVEDIKSFVIQDPTLKRINSDEFVGKMNEKMDEQSL